MLRQLALKSVLITVAFSCSLASAQVWDAARDFQSSNPSTQWTYGWKTAPAASLTAFPNYAASVPSFPGRDAWQDLSASSILAVYHNSVGVTGDIPTNMLLLQPDAGKFAVVEWTAPANIAVSIDGSFKSLDSTAASITVLSSLSGTRASGTVNSGAPTQKFGLLLSVAAGERIDFAVSGGGAGLNAVIRQLTLVGGSSLQSLSAGDTRLRLNSNASSQTGGAWTANKLPLADGFDTTFSFSIAQLTNGGADGFAFVLQNAAATILGGGGGGLGYNGVPASLAVEFDTYQNPENSDPNDNHIGVHTAGAAANSSNESASIGRTQAIANLSDGQWHTVRVLYVVKPQPLLSIYFDNTTTPVLQVPVDIATTLQLADGSAWVGFTGATGGATEVHDIQNWSFRSLDVHAPVLALPAAISKEADARGGSFVSYIASAQDAVDGARPAACSPASGTLFAVGATNVNCSATDLTGNAANGSFSVTVHDTTAPSLALPTEVTAAAVDKNGAAVSYIATATDIVDGAVTPVCAPAAGSLFSLGSTNVLCNAVDHAGNHASASFAVTVKDLTPPQIGAMSDISLEAVGPQTPASWPVPSATDNVDGAVPVSCAPASGSSFGIGVTNVQCSATDAAGNPASVSFTVTVHDSTPPVLAAVPANITAEATSHSGAMVTWAAPTASDLVDGSVPVTCLPASGSQFALGSTPVACTATDAHGNSASANFTVTVQDTTAPAIGNVPADVIVEATGPNGAIANWITPTATDLVDGSVPVTCVPASGAQFALGTANVTCSATDQHGNAASAKFAVTVRDTTPPAITGTPDNQVVEATGPNGAIATWTAPAANDVVDGALAVTCAPASGTQFAFGTTEVTCSAADQHGNHATSKFTVTVRDTTPPVISGVSANLTVNSTSAAGAVVTWPLPSANDLVDGSLPVTCSPAPGSQFALGVTTVNCSATDARGNAASAKFTVTVQDHTPPAISCALPDGLWHAADVSIACTASDTGSGLANAADASFSLSTSVATGTESSNASTAKRTVCDGAGNCATAGPIAGNRVDKRAPDITLSAPVNGTYLVHQSVTAAYSCADFGSGLASCVGTVATGAVIDTSTPGARQFTVNASDNAGNVSAASASYTVGFNTCLLSQNVAKKSDSTMPVRIQLCDASGANLSSSQIDVTAVGVITPTGAVIAAQDAGGANAGGGFRYLGGPGGASYVFNLQTKNLVPGTYRLMFAAGGDPTPHSVAFQITQ